MQTNNNNQPHKKVLTETKPNPHNNKGQIFYSFLLTAILSFIIFFIGYISIKNVIIEKVVLDDENALMLKNDINQYLGITLPEMYFNVDTKMIEAKLEKHPLIFKADVTKTIAGELLISIERTIPIVTILAQVGNTYIPTYFDQYGQCVQVGVENGIVDVPIVSGVKLVDPRVGVFLPDWLQKLIANMYTIKIEENNTYKQISEINIENREQSYRTLEINFIGYSSKFITEIEINSTKLKKLLQLAREFDGVEKLDSFEYFDTRQGVIIGKKRVNDS